MTMALVDSAIVCDCHGTQIMAKIRGSKLIIRVRSHGEYHTVVLPLDRFENTTLNSQK
jgi:hypothetical protein